MEDKVETNILSRLNYIKRVLNKVEIRARLDKNQDGTLVLLNPEFINDVPGIQDLYELAGSFNSPLLGYIGTQSSLIDAFFMSSDLKASTAILNLVMFGNYSQIQPEIAKGISAWLKLQRRVKSEIAEAGDHTTAPGTRNQEPKQECTVETKGISIYDTKLSTKAANLLSTSFDICTVDDLRNSSLDFGEVAMCRNIGIKTLREIWDLYRELKEMPKVEFTEKLRCRYISEYRCKVDPKGIGVSVNDVVL